MSGSTDLDTSETNEWLDSLRAKLHHQGPARAALRMFNVLNSIDLSYYGAIGCITPWEHPMKVTATVLRDDRWMPVQDAAQGRPILSVCYTTTLRLLS